MATVPITTLTPSTAPPADKTIRAIVTLSWPYSSSTRQCALLLADPDFRLRNRNGQIRVRFTGASAEAVAKAHVGIGDEVILGLQGALWEHNAEATRTPGKSVDGELMYRRMLNLTVARAGGDVEVNVNAPISPPRSVQQQEEPSIFATPLPKAVSTLPSSLDGTAESLPSYTYTSPAFTKRLRLSGESFLASAYDPFGADFDTEALSNRPRTSFGTGLRWRYAAKTPSPTKKAFEATTSMTPSAPDTSQATAAPLQDTSNGVGAETVVEDAVSFTSMPPPPLPRLQMPSGDTTSTMDDVDGPSTPKLQPVKSPTLPLPSPFPTDVAQAQLGFLGATLPAAGPNSAPPSADYVDAEEIAPEDESAVLQKANVYAYLSDTEPDEDSNRPGLVQPDVVMQEDTRDAGTDGSMFVEPTGSTDVNDIENVVESGPLEEPAVNYSLLDQLQVPQEPAVDVPVSREEAHSILQDHLRAQDPQTPRKAPPVLGLDGASSAPPSAHVTLQSEKERVMAQTYRSLFGFQKSPGRGVEVLRPAEPENPTPGFGFSDVAYERLEAAGVSNRHEDAAASPEERSPEPQQDFTEDKAQLVQDLSLPVNETRPLESEIPAQLPQADIPLYVPPRASTAPGSLVRASQTEVIELGSSSEEEEKEDERENDVDADVDVGQNAGERMGHVDPSLETAAPLRLSPQHESSEIQDSLEDSEAEALSRPTTADEGSMKSKTPVRVPPTVYEAPEVKAPEEVQKDEDTIMTEEEYDQWLEHERTETLELPSEITRDVDASMVVADVGREYTAEPPIDDVDEQEQLGDVDYPALPTTSPLRQDVAVTAPPVDPLISEDVGHVGLDVSGQRGMQFDMGFADASSAPLPEHDALGDANQRMEDAPPRSTAATDVVELGSSSPIEEPVEPRMETDAAFGGRLDEHVRDEISAAPPAEEVAISPSEPESPVEVSNKATLEAEVEVTTPAQSQDPNAQHQPDTTQTPSYPSLPLSPSNSQSVQSMLSQTAVESLLPRNVLPPTPQLTQTGSSTGMQRLVEQDVDAQELQPESQQAMPKLNEELPSSQIDQVTGLEKTALSQPSQVEPSTHTEHPSNELSTPKMQKKTPSRKSMRTRLSNVPDVISAWFSPKRSSGVVAEDAAMNGEDSVGLPGTSSKRDALPQSNGEVHVVSNGSLTAVQKTPHSPLKTNGFSTALSYFTSLSRLDELLNPASQQAHGANLIDVFAIVTDSTTEPTRAKAGPRDFYTIFRVSDRSLGLQDRVRVEVFRPWLARLPVTEVGDVVLLRAFAVKSRKRQAYLLSTDASSWCVWRYGDMVNAQDNKNKPMWARKGNANPSAVREEVKGPPVELGDEERSHAKSLREWWQKSRLADERDQHHRELEANGVNGHARMSPSAKL